MGKGNWRGFGLIIAAIISSLMFLACGSGRNSNGDPSAKALKRAASKAEFEAYLKASLTKLAYLDTSKGGAAFNGLGPAPGRANLTTAPAAATDAAGGGGASTAVSSTNVVEKGVDETDTVKTDGAYLYVLENAPQIYYGLPVQPLAQNTVANSVADRAAIGIAPPYPLPQPQPHKIRILQRDASSPGVVERAVLTLEKNVSSVDGFYLVDRTPDTKGSDTLFVIGHGDSSIYDAKTGYYNYSPQSYVVAYDVSAPEKPAILWNFSIEGYLNTSRSMNGRIYLVTQKYVWPQGLIFGATTPDAIANNESVIAKFSVDTLLPAVQIDGAAVDLVTANDCVIPSTGTSSTLFSGHLMTLVALPFADPRKATALCTPESSATVYSSLNALYTTAGEYIVPAADLKLPAEWNTVIHRFDYTNAGFDYAASGRVPGWIGWISNAFRLNENNGSLRIFTTQWGSVLQHQLHVLQQSNDKPGVLAVVATLPNRLHPEPIGKPGEDIHGVRFSGQHAYVVTFQRTDPLYAINLVKADDPFIEGELVIPGYSDYLHPLGENYLLGVGKDAVTVNGRTYTLGVKVGLFDVSDKGNLKVINEVAIGKRGSEAWVTSNYKSIAVVDDVANGKYRLMLPVNVHEYPLVQTLAYDPTAWYDWSYSGAHLFEIAYSTSARPALKQTGVLKSVERSNTTSFDYNYDARAIIVGDQVHYIQNAKVWSATWAAPEKAVGPQ